MVSCCCVQMCPNGSHPVPGGVFPAPPAAAELMVRLPPPTSFNGPFVAVDKLIDIFMNMNLPEKMPEPDAAQNGAFVVFFLNFFFILLKIRERAETLYIYIYI